MNFDATHGPWRQLKIQLRKTWNELTDEDLEAISRGGDLVRVVQHRYDANAAEAAQAPRRAEGDFQADQGLPGLPQASRYPRGKGHRIRLIPRISVCSSLSMLNRYWFADPVEVPLRTPMEDSPIEKAGFPS